MKNILVYNNNDMINKLSCVFAKEGIKMIVADSLKELSYLLVTYKICSLLTDIEFDESGIQSGVMLITNVRKISSVPIIVVSANESDTSKIMALNAGADDYVTLQCNSLELLARVKSQIRRYTKLSNICTNVDRIYKIGNLEIDDICRKVTVEGREVKLTPIEYEILRLLVSKRGKVFSIQEIYESIWKMQAFSADNTIAVHIRHIREKIERNPKEPRYLKVVWGAGYKVG